MYPYTLIFKNKMDYSIVVPVYNGGLVWQRSALKIRSLHPKPTNVLVLDSYSEDGSGSLARDLGFMVIKVRQDQFDHGGTRQLGAQLVGECDILIFLTQDAEIEAADTVRVLLSAFNDPRVGTAYGQQLPKIGAKPIEAHARLFNYPDQAYVRNANDIRRFGIKAAFNSDSFSAYRLTALNCIGGFPQKVILGEDMFVAAKMLLAGWSVAYVPEARVFHSHNYTLAQEFRRYFDIGAFHAMEPWLLRCFGSPRGEGGRFVLSELQYLLRHAPWLIPEALLRTAAKYSGYLLGKRVNYLPPSWRTRLSMHRAFWYREMVD